MSDTFIDMIEAERIIVSCVKKDEPLLVLGSPGMGKTALFSSTAKNLGIGYIPNILSQKDPVDVGGMRVPDMNTGRMKHYTPEDLPVEETYNGPDGKKAKHSLFPEKGILHYDEINVVSMLMQATAYGIINERRVGLKQLKPGWVPMASGNHTTDRSAAQRLSLALANRFNVQRVKPSLKAWLAQYGSANVDARGTAFLRFRPELFYVLPKPGDDDVRFPSARSWTKALKFIDEEPVLRRKIIAGYVGEAPAEEFEAFWRIMEKAITFEDIVRNPKTAPVPSETEPGLYYAVSGMLARSVDRKTFAPVMEYVSRMMKDYQVMVVQDATKREPTLKNTTAYGKWAVENQAVTL